ncbi:hypothetical protein SAMN05216296_0301 [Pseudomonas pohangensis]|uniref:Uncharacterized protein n=1 Tax=Pseudomonas pohangensis TaxID=364197 RepID=A0A1H2E1Z9_9PSED|nr:DUF2092 domain-containing protein [Pseudomonas pohangensis]SDT89085.1 hypothetical protein SAMN05216296_0301 [Pseudomonas pohangensis]
MFLHKKYSGWLIGGLFGSLLALQLPAAEKPPVEAPAVRLEARALDVLQAMSARLAAARGLSFKAVSTYEKPSRLGPPLAYSTTEQVTLQRPDRLRVLTSGDGPVSEFYYDGQQVFAYVPADNLLAVADAPPSIDATLQAAYQQAAIYFPFTDVIVANPYRDLAADMRLAFYIGESKAVGDTTTDVIAYASDDVFVQAWIGRQDKLPRLMRAVFRDDPAQLRQQVAFSDWKLDSALPESFFRPANIKQARLIEFAAPQRRQPLPAAKQTAVKP